MCFGCLKELSHRDGSFEYPHMFWLRNMEQVAQWATIAHLGASIMFGDTIKAGNSELETVTRN